jgi:hypothetical protein
LDVLRRTNSELVAKNTNRKQRIAELEATVADLQGKVAERDTSLRAITIDGPLKSMAESLSNCPELWIEQFSKSYRLEMVKGELTLLSVADGKPVTKDGKPIPFERDALTRLLTGTDHPQAKIFNAITIASRASGGAETATRRKPTSAPSPSKMVLGLR